MTGIGLEQAAFGLNKPKAIPVCQNTPFKSDRKNL